MQLAGTPKKDDVSGVRNWTRRETESYVWAQFEIADTTSDVLIVRVIQVTVKDFLGQSEWAFQPLVSQEGVSMHYERERRCKGFRTCPEQ